MKKTSKIPFYDLGLNPITMKKPERSNRSMNNLNTSQLPRNITTD